MNLYRSFVVLFMLSISVQNELTVDSQGNIVQGEGNYWNGQDNTIKGQSNSVNGNTNAVSGNSNSIQGSNNQVTGSGNVVGSISQEDLTSLQQKMAQQLASRFGNFFPNQASSLVVPTSTTNTVPSQQGSSIPQPSKPEEKKQETEENKYNQKTQSTPAEQTVVKVENKTEDIKEVTVKEEVVKEIHEQGEQNNEIKQISVRDSGLWFHSLGSLLPLRDDWIEKRACLRLGLCAQTRLFFSSIFSL